MNGLICGTSGNQLDRFLGLYLADIAGVSDLRDGRPIFLFNK